MSVCLSFYSVASFADYRSDTTHNRPSVSEAFLRFTDFRYSEFLSFFSATDGITYPAFIKAYVHKLIETHDKDKEVYFSLSCFYFVVFVFITTYYLLWFLFYLFPNTEFYSCELVFDSLCSLLSQLLSLLFSLHTFIYINVFTCLFFLFIFPSLILSFHLFPTFSQPQSLSLTLFFA